MKMKVLLIIVGAVIIGVAVYMTQRQDFSNTSLNGVAASNVPVTKIAQGTQTAITGEVNYVITSEDQLNKLWDMVDATGTPPVINFDSQAVLAVFAGSKSNTSISVTKVEDTDQRVVYIRIVKPGTSCEASASDAAPYEIVSVPTTTLQLGHQYVSTTQSCAQ